MSTTTNMNLDLPNVNTTPGPAWAQKLLAALDKLDSHDHAAGNGVKVTPSGMNIIEDLVFNSKNATKIRSARFSDNLALQLEVTDKGCIQLVNGDLWWVNGSGVGVQITSGAGLNFASLGTIGGDFGQAGVPASVTYSNFTKTFSFLKESGKTANLFLAKISIASPNVGALSVSISSSASSAAYEIVLPIAAPTANTILAFDALGQGTFRSIVGSTGEVTVTPSASSFVASLPSAVTKQIDFQGNNTHSGNNVGRGIIPIGSVLATFPNLTGAYNCLATTAADANGFVQCAGQTIADASSPMNGAVIPNINANVFLRGNVSSGSTGGADSYSLTQANIGNHTHEMAHVHKIIGASVDNASRMRVSIDTTNPTAFAATGSTEISTIGPSAGNLGFNSARPEAYSWSAVGTGGTAKNSTGNLDNFFPGTVTAFGIVPTYISARFIMRIK